jgi:hypothetical protein
MRIKITKKHNNTLAWYNNYLNKEFDVLSKSVVGVITVKLPNLDFHLPTLGLVWVKNRRYTHGLIHRGYYEFVKEQDNERN